MTPIKRLKLKLTSIADNIRDKTGVTKKLTLDQMSEEISWLDSDVDDTETYILVDQNGNEIAAVATDEIVEITATPNDIRLGTTAVTGEGIVTGEKKIPSYYVHSGRRIVTKNSPFIIPSENYDYTQFQCMICKYNKDMNDSVYTEKVVIEDSVYNVLSTEPVSTVVKNDENSTVDLGITNESDSICLIRYFMYKEVY